MLNIKLNQMQDLGHVLDADANNLGLEVEDRRQRSKRLLVKSGDGELQAIRERAGSAAAVATVRDAKTLKDKVRFDICVCVFIQVHITVKSGPALYE